MIGDVVKTLSPSGSSIILSGGFVQTTTGRMTAILYSLFSSSWVGNLFVTGNEVLGSDFQNLHSQTMTLDTLLDIAASAQQALAWFVNSGDAKEVKTATRIIDGGTIITEIDFTENDDSVTRIEVWKHPQYWEVREV